MKKTLQYLNATKDHSIGYTFKKEDLHITAYYDADFAGDSKDSKSTAGYVLI